MLQFHVIGNLGADAQVKEFNGRKAIVFNVAHTDRWTDESGTKHETTIWVSCIWNKEEGKVLEYLKKGTTIYAIGDGSARVFSSEQQRKMVAGLNLRINHLELVGGSREDVPRQLVDKSGLIHDTYKAYYVNQESVKAIGATAQLKGEMFDVRGNQYLIDQYGFITTALPAASEPARQSEQNDAPFAEENQYAQKMANTKAKSQ